MFWHMQGISTTRKRRRSPDAGEEFDDNDDIVISDSVSKCNDGRTAGQGTASSTHKHLAGSDSPSHERYAGSEKISSESCSDSDSLS